MNHNWILSTIIFIFQLCYCGMKKTYKNYKYFEIEGNQSDIVKLTRYLSKIDKSSRYEMGYNKTHVLLHPSVITRFKDFAILLSVKATLINDDVSKLLKQETVRTLRETGKFKFDSFYGTDDINSYLLSLQEENPEWIDSILIGESYEQRKIMGLKIITDVPLRGRKPKPVVFIHGGIHGNQWVSPASVLYFLTQLLSDARNMTILRNSFEWHIFPVLNPDGYEYSMKEDRMWMKSRSIYNETCAGVNLDRNWNYQFGEMIIRDPCDQFYLGEKAFSEVETRSMATYMLDFKNITIAYFSIHTNGGVFLVPYSNTLLFVEDRDLMEAVGMAAKRFCGVKSYRIGTAFAVFGDIYTGTSLDWTYSKLKPPIAFTIDLRQDDTLISTEDKIVKLGEELKKMLLGMFIEGFKQNILELARPKDFKIIDYDNYDQYGKPFRPALPSTSIEDGTF